MHQSEMEYETAIASMTAGDLDEVLKVEQLCHSQPWSAATFRQELANPLATIDLLRLDGKLAGFLCAWWIGTELEIHDVATAPTFRRRGVASRLLRHVIERGRQQGVLRSFLEVRAGNVAAIGLYRAFGFQSNGRRRGYYPDGEDALLLELSVS